MRFEVIYANARILAAIKKLKAKRNKMYSVICFKFKKKSHINYRKWYSNFEKKAAVQKSTGVSQHLLWFHFEFFRLSLCSGASPKHQWRIQGLELLSIPTLANFKHNGDQTDLCKRNFLNLERQIGRNKIGCKKWFILHQRNCYFRVRPMNICCWIFTFNSPSALATYLWAYNLLQAASSQSPLFPQSIFVSICIVLSFSPSAYWC